MTVESLYGVEASDSELAAAFTGGEIETAVYGLGKMGLPLASVYADVSGNVVGADVDQSVVDAVNDGKCHVDREPGLDELVADTVSAGAFRAVSDPKEAAASAALHVVIVPTPITDDKEPDLSILDSVVEDIGSGLSAGDTVVIECTVPPNVTSERVEPALVAESGLSADDFGLAFCPERTASGRAIEDITGAYPKVVGGVDEESTRIARVVYDEITDNEVIPVTDATTAECVKLTEGLYRDVNIALANELATLSDELGTDVREVFDVANTAPYVEVHRPGPGVGGHCIPYYPYFLIKRLDGNTDLLETARSVNDRMPQFTIEKLAEELRAEGTTLDGARVLVLGLTYRAGVAETRKSPGIEIVELLADAGASVDAVDPMLDDVPGLAGQLKPLDDVTGGHYDAVIDVTHHEEFDEIDWTAFDRTEGQLIVIDGRDDLSLDHTSHRVYTLGDGRY
jgi:UDP-N-acetyl-D-mannosaminuronic acid dehydrogenase